VTAAPSYPHDLFTDEMLTDPYEHYRALRDLGPVVWLDAHGMYAVARYAEARATLADPGTYCSGPASRSCLSMPRSPAACAAWEPGSRYLARHPPG